ncbi:MAG: hypothetical protein QM751_03845 [Paludibacteraceae bacterium]
MKKNVLISKTIVLILFTLFLDTVTYAQDSKDNGLNLDFEFFSNGAPLNWKTFGNDYYKVYADSICVKNGKYSVVIENTSEDANFKALSFTIPHNYIGKSIRLSGYIKTENVTNGYAGLWMRIDPGVGFDNMQNRGIKGTTDWKEYEIVLPLNPSKTDDIVIGGLLAGNGKMWVDNLSITVDGKELYNKDLEIYKKEVFSAQKDKEFDNGSNIHFPVIDKIWLSNLELLGRIWGFIKYHHPEIAKGNYNWDYELFRILPDYLNAKKKYRKRQSTFQLD